MISGIYEIKNKINGNRYVGSSKNITYRFRKHREYLRKGNHFNNHLQNAWDKYGEDNFEFNILFECREEFLLIEEQKRLNKNPEYNIAKYAMSPMRGRKHSDETKEKMSGVRKGRVVPEKTKVLMSLGSLGKQGTFTGRKHSEETKRKMSEAQKGHAVSKEARKKLSEFNTGRKLTEGHKKAISDGLKNRKEHKLCPGI